MPLEIRPDFDRAVRKCAFRAYSEPRDFSVFRNTWPAA
jgi:hypothetical protein